MPAFQYILCLDPEEVSVLPGRASESDPLGRERGLGFCLSGVPTAPGNDGEFCSRLCLQGLGECQIHRRRSGAAEGAMGECQGVCRGGRERIWVSPFRGTKRPPLPSEQH